MEYRQLGRSGLHVPVLSLGTGTFGGTNARFAKWGQVQIDEARRLIDRCLDAGVNFFDTANGYSDGAAEQILGRALGDRRSRALIATKAAFPVGDSPNDRGTSRHHLTAALHDSLRRLGTDYVDVYFMHAQDTLTPVEETLHTLDGFIRAGKIRYIGCSNFSGWHAMKSLAVAERYGLARYVVHQAYYSLVGRDYEWELMPLALDQGLGTMVWSPLGWGRLTGRIRRGQPLPEGRIRQGGGEGGPQIDDEYLFTVVDALLAVAEETGRTVPQVAINWLLHRPSVVNVVIGARNEQQLIDNLGAVGWSLTPQQIARLDDASRRHPAYPYWHQMNTASINPMPVAW